MGKVDDVVSSPRPFAIGRQLSISYHAVWLIVAGSDLLFIVLSCALASWGYNFAFYNIKDSLNSGVVAGIIIAVLFVLMAKNFGIYEFNRLLNPAKYTSSLMIAWALSVLLTLSLFFLLRAGTDFSRGSTIISAVFTAAPLVLTRYFFARAFRSLMRQGAIAGPRALIIGEETELERLEASSLLLDHGLTEVARVGLAASGTSSKFTNKENSALEYALSLAKRRGAEELLIAVDWRKAEVIDQIKERLRISPLPVRLLPDKVLRSRFQADAFLSVRSLPLVELQRAPLTRGERLVKRCCDIVLGTAALVILAPVIALTALVVRLDSTGPIIFRQRRTGFNGETFSIYKFRTMYVMEDGKNIVQTRKNDPRVTRVGRLLRASSIDELPQIFNVLRGEMSLVGPRPHALAHDDQYGAIISSYAFRHHVKPGITGWAQVNGFRGETRVIEDMEKRIEHDLWYVNNWSITLDLKIIWRTSFSLLRHRAY